MMLEDPANDANKTVVIQQLLDQVRHGDTSQIRSLLDASMYRLTLLTRKVSNHSPVKRFEQTEDILQNTLLRLWSALEKHQPVTTLDYFRLAAAIMRRELIDLSRHYFGVQGLGANLAQTKQADSGSDFISPVNLVSDHTNDPASFDQWSDFHAYIENLPSEERDLFDLIWYQGLTIAEAADLLGSSERTIRRRWREARLSIQQNLTNGP